jgi:hypothetical protein
MPVEMKSVYSSFISEIGYDPETQELHVTYQRGGGSVYAGVPPEDALKITDAPSIGEALHNYVRGRYEHRSTKG